MEFAYFFSKHVLLKELKITSRPQMYCRSEEINVFNVTRIGPGKPGKFGMGFPFLCPSFSSWSRDRPPAVLSRIAHTVALRGSFSLSRKGAEVGVGESGMLSRWGRSRGRRVFTNRLISSASCRQPHHVASGALAHAPVGGSGAFQRQLSGHHPRGAAQATWPR